MSPRDPHRGGQPAAEAAAPSASSSAPPPATSAATQLRYEKSFTDAQKLDFAFRYAEKAAQRLDEREQADRYVARALDALRTQITNANLQSQVRDEQLLVAITRLTRQVEELDARLTHSLGPMLELIDLVRDDVLASDCYNRQAIEALDRAMVAVHGMPAMVRSFLELWIADLSLATSAAKRSASAVETEAEAAPIIHLRSSHSSAAD